MPVPEIALPEPEVSQPVTPVIVAPAAVETPPAKISTRVKTTINLQNILAEKPGTSNVVKESGPKFTKRKLSRSEVTEAWQEFAETRKTQVAEFSLLQRSYEIDDNIIKLQLTNPVEESLLSAIRTDLLTFLKDKLQCEIGLEGVLLKAESKKMIYTNKEKFDHLAEKHPALLELKERLGLDTDY